MLNWRLPDDTRGPGEGPKGCTYNATWAKKFDKIMINRLLEENIQTELHKRNYDAD
jgi:hypothetical protein